jgi:putative acetyltransferase
MLTIAQAQTNTAISEARVLFREYEAWLGLDLCFQGFEAELAGLPGEYSAPAGRLFLASVDGDLAGCAAFRKLEPRICEMKRLFVREHFRGRKVGHMLIERLLVDARKSGYERMRLDTYPAKMARAVGLYGTYGFRVIEPYYNNPYQGVMFMELVL